MTATLARTEWRWKTLGDVAEVVGGGTPSTTEPSYFGGDIPWITPADLSGYKKKYISAGSRNLTDLGLANSGARLMPAGTVLFSSRAPIGYVAIAANPVCTNQGFKSFVLNSELLPDFVYYYLQHAKKLAIDLASGTTFLEISGMKAAQIPIPIPPLEEQDRIVQEIETQLSRLEAGVNALKRAQANLKRYRAAVLKAACEGRLVPTEAELARAEARNYETGAQLFNRVTAERYRQVKKAAETAELPGGVSLPDGWTWASLGSLSVFQRNGISTKPDADQGTPVLRISAVRPLRVYVDDVRYLPGLPSTYQEYVLDAGDLLFTRYNGNPALVGVCGVVPEGTTGLTHPDKLIRCKLALAGVHPAFVAIMANVGWSRAYLGKRVRTTAGQAGISGGDLKTMPIPLPPLAEQERIVADVERRLSVVDELEATITANHCRAIRLRQSVLQKGFDIH